MTFWFCDFIARNDSQKVLLSREFLSIVFKSFKISLLIIKVRVFVFGRDVFILGINIFRFVSSRVKIKIKINKRFCLFFKGLECCLLPFGALLAPNASH